MQDRRSWPTCDQFVALPNEELGKVDPVVVNLVVARGIPSLVDLDVGRYVELADQWADDLLGRMPALETEFHKAPGDWRGDFDFFRLGLVCWYVDVVLGVAYREDQRNAARILYTDATDLFLNGVMDTRRGTCGNLALLHVVLGRRIGLPVSLACAGSHFICRFDDGTKTINIDATETGHGGFSSRPDEYVLAQWKLPAKAQACGSDLRGDAARNAGTVSRSPCASPREHRTTRRSGAGLPLGPIPFSNKSVVVCRAEPDQRSVQHRPIRAAREGAPGRSGALVAGGCSCRTVETAANTEAGTDARPRGSRETGETQW